MAKTLLAVDDSVTMRKVLEITFSGEDFKVVTADTSQGAIVRSNGRYRVDYAKIGGAVDRLAKELLEQEATGDRARAEAWFAKYAAMPADLAAALHTTSSVPVDVDPVTSFGEEVE